MAIGLEYLADESALARLRLPPVDAALTPLILAGRVATCGIIELEVLYSTRGHADLERTRQIRAEAFPMVPVLQHDFDRATDVMGLLAAVGLHRSAGIPDLLIAAVAERSSLCVLHYDEDFDRIASVTSQPMRWVVPKGSI